MLSVSKKISGDDTKKGYKLMQAQVKMLVDFYKASAKMLNDCAGDTSLMRKSVTGVACAACDKDVSGLYDLINQTQEFSNWNKFPQHEGSNMGKVLILQILNHRELDIRKF